MSGYDVIGDVHGQADKLEGLLHTMGYRLEGGSWRHPERTAVFIGDLIDRGPRQLDSVEIARRMVDEGDALIVMGNHEFNAIAYFTEHPDGRGDTLRTRQGELGCKNLKQHKEFLDEVGDRSPLHGDVIEWFATIPLWLELDGVRFIHACWHAESIDVLRPALGPGNTVTSDVMVTSSTEGHPHFTALENIIKGPEVALPEGQSYEDKDGNKRHRRRVSWWTGEDGHYTDDVPLFFGHYWSSEDSLIHSPRTLCVDLSAARGGPLAAYRWDGESTIDLDKLVTFNTP